MSQTVQTDENVGAVRFSNRYRWYVLFLLTVVYHFNFMDRYILSILMPQIKAEMNLSDTELGFLSGLAFALFYSTLGIPIARWADRGTRRNIIALALAVWSAMTAVCGLATNFTQLLLARIGVGVGEAGCSPPAHSMISDYFPPDRRGTAMSIYALGIPVGILVGLSLGGFLAELYGWKITFLIMGIPGVVLAVIVRLTLKEPPRGYSEGLSASASTVPIMEVFRFLWEKKTFRHLSFAAALHGFAGYGIGQWQPTFLVRIHDMSIADVGYTLALLAGFAAGLGTFLGGTMTDRLQKRDMRWIVWVPAVSTILALPFGFPVYLLDDTTMVIVSMILPAILGAMWLGPTFALVQGLVGLTMRAMAVAILFLILNLIGLGLGPLLVGVVSDVFTGLWGPDGLRYALLAFTAVNLWSALHYFIAARTINQDMA